MIKTLSKILFALALVTIVGFVGAKGVLAYNERTIICTGGSYFDRYGPSEYWWEHSGYGWCNKTNPGWCENGQCSDQSPYNGVPRSMWKTWSGCSLSNYARWNMGNIAQWSYWYAFIPSNYATTTRAPYTVTYNGASSYSFEINQNNYYNYWVSFPTGENRWQIMNTWLDDDTCESPSTQIGFDETEICKEASQWSAYCPGNHAP